jgi:hypothetical protein
VNRWGGRAATCIAVIGLLAFAGCTTGTSVDRGTPPPTTDPWQTTVHYVDPAGRFGLDFPAAPALSSEPDGSLVIHTLRASGGGDWGFELAWSDALPGSALLPGQALSPQTPQQNASGDGGKVTHQATVPMFGRDAIEFTVQSLTAGQGLYRDREVVIGGRLYEFTVLQRSGGSAAFDRFVQSFRLLEPPARADADFFGQARSICQALRSSVPTPPKTATPAQRGAAVSKTADLYEVLAKRLATTPAAPKDQGEAAAMIDAIRRSIAPARAFAKAVTENRSDAAALGRATHADTDLLEAIARRHGAAACG